MTAWWLFVVLPLCIFAGIAVSEVRARRRRKRNQQAARNAAVLAERLAHPVFRVAVEDPTPDETDQSDELSDFDEPTIGDTREGAALQDRWRPHTACVDSWADRTPSKICPKCAPVFGLRTVKS